ncbi:CRISPR-associated helicase Cas3' [Ensifer soli]|uniref:CRISPR-associated helicase Cas3' n=1 Tax=Ciceribacter sp. sgz301302 TaxID=3342379 RepID=UPI0035B91DA8
MAIPGVEPDRSDWQRLDDHAIAVARLAAAMASAFGLEKAAHLLGLLHDLGKYTPEFQRRLEGADIRVDHSTAGARLLTGDFARGLDKSIAELLAYCVAGHHTGLPDWHTPSPSCLKRRLAGEILPVDEIWKTELAPSAEGLVPSFISRFDRQDRQVAAFQFSMIARMLFSCLVDADFKDTEAFYQALDGRTADRDWPELQASLPEFLRRFDAHMAAMGAAETDLNRLRRDVLSHVRARATEGRGLFTLTVPTGGGKTLASLAFALDHAKACGHTRIIYAIPFTSIIDQTAAIFRAILGDDNVLEHHSAIDDDTLDREDGWKSRDKLRLAMEDWAAPVVVTTNVQLFESLFSARTSRARKVHNIANSVIILDEAQTLPRHLLLPVLRMLDELALNYGCSIVLCTATQPALDRRKLKGGLALEGRELAPDPQGLFAALRRTRIVQAGEMDNDALIAALSGEPQALVIVNSRRHALDLYTQADAAGLDGLIHLTTRQYAAHRRQILADVRARLAAGTPCRVIATSLIEAGVDVDFPKAWRAEAGLDQIIQAAGRVNREGRRPLEESIVTVFSASAYPPPSEIRGLVSDMQRVLKRQEDLQSLPAIEDYFGEVYWRVGRDGLDRRVEGKGILDHFVLTGQGTDFSFRTVGERFRMIESTMVPVIVPGDAIAEKAVRALGSGGISAGRIARKLQAYLVQVPVQARQMLIDNGHVGFVRPDLWGDQFAILKTMSLYRPEIGLLWEDAAYLAVENSII